MRLLQVALLAIFTLTLYSTSSASEETKSAGDGCCPEGSAKATCCLIKDGDLSWEPVGDQVSISDIHLGTGTSATTGSTVMMHLRIWNARGEMIGTTIEAAPLCCGVTGEIQESASERLLRTNMPVQLVMGVGAMHPDLEAGLRGMAGEGKRIIRLKRSRAAKEQLIYGKSVTSEESDDPGEPIYVEVSLIAVRERETGRVVKFR